MAQTDFLEVMPNGILRLHPHQYQQRALDSKARIVLVLAGAQGGKSVIGPEWLRREMVARGVGDYLAVTSTFPLFQNKLQPLLNKYFVEILRIAQWREAKKTFEFTDGTRLILGSAANPESLEAATAKAAWLDEAGQNQFSVTAWEAITRRLSRHQGRVLITTTPYNFGWLKTEVYDRWLSGDKDIEVITFPSIANPAFPLKEWERLKRSLPDWKFQMFYEGRFTRPAGAVYDSFVPERHIISEIPLNPAWPRYVGMDFGGQNTAALWLAHDTTTGNLYVYREYLNGSISIADHVRMLKELSGKEMIMRCIGGAWSEDQWRQEFSLAGWHVERPPIKDVTVGIQKVYSWHKANKLFVFNTCQLYIDEKLRYSYAVDADYNVSTTIEDKETFHLLDCERYVLSDFDEPQRHALLSELGEPALPVLTELK